MKVRGWRFLQVALGVAVVLLVALSLSVDAPAEQVCTITWTGGAENSSWAESSNWNLNRPPTTADHVCITAASTVEVSQDVGSVQTLQSEGTLVLLPGSRLRLAAVAEESSTLSLVQSGGALGGRGSLSISASFEWSGGEQLEAATTEVLPGATLVIKPGSALLEKQRVLRVDAGASASMAAGGALSIGESATVKNAGTFTAEGTGEKGDGIFSVGAGGVFRNTGTFTRSGNRTFAVGVEFDNEGAVAANFGALSFEGGGTEATGATFAGSGSEGLVTFAQGTFRFASGVALSGRIAQTGGRIQGPLLVKGHLEWSSGEQAEAATTEIVSGASLQIKSSVSLEKGRLLQVDAGATVLMGSGARLYIGEGASVKNAGTFNADGDGENGDGIASSGVGGFFQNAGTFARAGNGSFSVGVQFNNEGSVVASLGNVSLEAGGVQTATASFTGSGSEGLVTFTQGTFTLAGGVGLSGRVAQTGGRIQGPLLVKGSLEWSGGEQAEAATTEIASGAALVIKSGGVSLEKGRVLQVDSGAIATMGVGGRLTVGENATIKNSGTFSAEGSGERGDGIFSGSIGGLFRNTGTFTRSGNRVFAIGVEFENEGSVVASFGVVRFEAGGGAMATASYNGSGTEGLVSFAQGTFSFAGGATITGRIAQIGGRIQGPLMVKGSFEWSGGEQAEAATTEILPGAALLIASGTVSLEQGRALQVDAGANATMGVAGRLTLGENAVVKNAGSFNAEGDGERGDGIYAGGAGCLFRNTGTFTRSGNRVFAVGVKFDNEGALVASLGAVRLEGGGAEAPKAVFTGAGSEGLVSFAQGTFTLAPGLSLNGNVAQVGGRIQGPLVVKGSFEWLGGEQAEAAATEVAAGATLLIRSGSVSLEEGRRLLIDADAAASMGVGAKLYIGAGAVVKNAGTFTAEGNGEDGDGIFGRGVGGVFQNAGTFTRAGNRVFPVGVEFDNEKTVLASLGVLRLEAGGAAAPTASFIGSGADGLVSFAQGTFSFASGVSLGGRVAQIGGRVQGPLLIKGSFEWSGGEQAEAATEVTAGGTLMMATGTVSLERGRVLQVDPGATASMATGARLYIGEGAVVKNAGTFNAEGSGEGGDGIFGLSAVGTFRNTGTFVRDGAGEFSVAIGLYNEGAVDIALGVLKVATFTEPRTGVLGVHLGGLQLGAGFTQLILEGANSIEGTLRITTEAGFHPEPGQHFQVLSANPLIGSFGAVQEVGSIGGGWTYTPVYSATGVDLVVAGGPVPTTTTATISGGGQTGGTIALPENSVVTATATLTGVNAASAAGSISYRVYSDSGCSNEVANAGNVAVGAGAVGGSSPEVFPPGTYYWQASYSGDATNQRSSSTCGAAVETVEGSNAGKQKLLGFKEELQSPVSGRTANLLPVSGVVLVQIPGNRSFQALAVARNVPIGTLVNAKKGLVTLCRATQKSAPKQCAELNGGEFRIEEQAGGSAAHLALTGGLFAGCPASRAGAARAASRSGKQAVRNLWGRAHGNFTTDGRNSSTTIRGTIWSVEDRCTFTRTRVTRGVVSVYDYRRHRSIRVSAGRSYTAQAR